MFVEKHNINSLADYQGTLADFKLRIEALILLYGNEAIIKTDAGHNNVAFKIVEWVEPKKKPRWSNAEKKARRWQPSGVKGIL